MTKASQGFTLIELMIVVAIIGILAAIAIPQYQAYIARSQAAESIVMIDSAKVMVEDYVSTYGSFPNNKTSLVNLNVGVIGTYGSITGVSNVTTDGGELIYKISTNGTSKHIQNKSVWFTRTSISGQWSCQSNLPTKYAPKNCTFNTLAPSGS